MKTKNPLETVGFILSTNKIIKTNWLSILLKHDNFK
jgi:hypothetical protein